VSTVLITGGHAGIGLVCAEELASVYRCDLILAGRSVERMDAAAGRLRTHGVTVHTLQLDTSSLQSVRAAAESCRTLLATLGVQQLQAILCNAGAQFHGAISYSVDGYEETLATNVLGHFLLVELLFDCMADHGRIVFTASGTHDPDTADGKAVGKVVEPDAYTLVHVGKNGRAKLSAGVRYSTSKLCNMLHAYELARRLRRSGSTVASIAYDPGAIPETGLIRTAPRPVRWLAKTALTKCVFQLMGITTGDLSFSGASLAKIAVDPAFADGSGKYFQSNAGRLLETRSSTMSYDEKRAIDLWNASRELVRLRADEEPWQLR
jgi:NAD(P)-dependent dehydrogenase (short-subunit alcohol dehydrogenase family)